MLPVIWTRRNERKPIARNSQMAIAKLEPAPKFDLGTKMVPWKERHAEGKALRRAVPRESHAQWQPRKDRPAPLKLLAESNKGRQKHLVPLRMGRMAASPFAFLRGSACVMASDLSRLPINGIPVCMDGDAHINNFGMYGTPQREVVFDMNDFDEATIGPWERDLKRLVASVNVAGRQNGLNRRERAAAVRRAMEGYRFNANRLQSMGVLDIFYLHAYPGRENPLVNFGPKSKAVFSKTVAKALRTDNRTLLPKVADQHGGGKWTFRNDPPVLTTVPQATKEKVIGCSISPASARSVSSPGQARRDRTARSAGFAVEAAASESNLKHTSSREYTFHVDLNSGAPRCHNAWRPRVRCSSAPREKTSVSRRAQRKRTRALCILGITARTCSIPWSALSAKLTCPKLDNCSREGGSQ
jgi:Uncharacterized protein conserved in bacteria (DUF2252)